MSSRSTPEINAVLVGRASLHAFHVYSVVHAMNSPTEGIFPLWNHVTIQERRVLHFMPAVRTTRLPLLSEPLDWRNVRIRTPHRDGDMYRRTITCRFLNDDHHDMLEFFLTFLAPRFFPFCSLRLSPYSLLTFQRP